MSITVVSAVSFVILFKVGVFLITIAIKCLQNTTPKQRPSTATAVTIDIQLAQDRKKKKKVEKDCETTWLFDGQYLKLEFPIKIIDEAVGSSTN